MNDFDKKLQDIIEERQTVMFEIERVLYTKRYNLSQKHFDIFSIHSISIIYSIWEGFIQKSFQLYVDELNKLNLNFNEFNNEIIIFHMENTFKQLLEYPQRNNKKVDYYKKLDFFFNEKRQELSRTINTNNNVSFEVLNKLLKTFGLEPFPEFWGNYKHPKPSLKKSMFNFLRYRNGVSHGGDISSEEKVSHEVFEKYKNLILDLMYGLYNKMIYGLTQKTYKTQR